MTWQVLACFLAGLESVPGRALGFDILLISEYNSTLHYPHQHPACVSWKQVLYSAFGLSKIQIQRLGMYLFYSQPGVRSNSRVSDHKDETFTKSEYWSIIRFFVYDAP